MESFYGKVSLRTKIMVILLNQLYFAHRENWWLEKSL